MTSMKHLLGWWIDGVTKILVVCFPGRVTVKMQVSVGWVKNLELGLYLPGIKSVS